LQSAAFNREKLVWLTDGLAVALAASLPWSTSATGILAVLWLLAVLATVDLPSLRRITMTPAGLLPLLFVGLGAAGMLWADVSWAERYHGIGSFFKLLCIPLLLWQFSRSSRTRQVLIGFLGACVLLLAYSWIMFVWPSVPALGNAQTGGIPVKDYISQSAMFTVCVFIVSYLACDYWRAGRHYLALALVALAMIFLVNVLYIATSRTALVVISLLVALFGYCQFKWKGVIGFVAGFAILAVIAWPLASYLQFRITTFFEELQTYHPGGDPTSAGERLEFWQKSLGFIKTASIIGHGTGSIREQFRISAVGRTGMAGEVSSNPHNQILAIGIQLGFVGIAMLLAMWIAHAALFQSAGLAAWVGLVVVVQNVVGSLFNSHLADFTHSWLYVVGVGVAGGISLRRNHASMS
jgi:O-antigen ligase